MIVKCDYCNKEFERNIYCCASHKVMHHRQLTNGKQSVNQRLITNDNQLTKGQQLVNDSVTVGKPIVVEEWQPPLHLSKDYQISKGKKRT
jgi:hypothetical protein